MINSEIFFILYGLAHKSALFDKIAVFITDPLVYIMVVIISIYFLFEIKDLHRKIDFNFILEKIKIFIPIFVSGVLSWGIGDLLKSIFNIDRPFVVFTEIQTLVPESGFSFPSLHATFITAIAFSVYFKNRSFGYICLLIALLIGLSRIIVGVHYPVDVLGGFVLGFIIAYFVNKISKKLIK